MFGHFKVFRLPWDSRSDEYMFLWNAAAATHTMKQLSPGTLDKVQERYEVIIVLNRVDPMQDLGIARPDPFWLSVTLADLGILPILGNKNCKWYYVQDHRRVPWNIAPQGEALWTQVCKDIFNDYDVEIESGD